MKHYRPFLFAVGFICTIVLSSFITNQTANESYFLGDFVDLDTVRVQLTDCNAKGTVCLPLSLGQAIGLVITDNGESIPVTFMNGCDFDTSSAYTYSTLFGQGKFGPYDLQSWPVNGQIFSGTFNTIPQLVDSMNTWDPMGNWALDSAHLLILGGNSNVKYDTMRVWVTQIATPSYIGYNLGITPNGTQLSFDRGFHTVILKDTLTNIADTFYVHATCSETINLRLERDSSATACVDFSDLLGNPQGLSWCTAAPAADIAQFAFSASDSCVNITGIANGQVSACAVLCDDSGFCDTTYFNVTVYEPGVTDYIHLEIGPDELGSYCFDTTGFSQAVPAFTVCGLTGNGFAALSFNPFTYCIDYQGMAVTGSDTICVEACTQGICDTTYLFFDVKRQKPITVYDTLWTNFSNTYCVDQSRMTGSIDSFYAISSPDASVASFKLDSTNWCVDYTGLSPNTDTITVVLQDGNGVLDTTFIVLTIRAPRPEVVVDTLFVGEIMDFCMSTNQLAGNNFTVTDICANLNGNFITFAPDTLSLCVEIEAIATGTDTACFVICDDLGACDTIIFYISAQGLGNQTPPVARPDVSVTIQNTPVVITVLNNDTLNGTFSDLLVLPPTSSIGPIGGSTTVDLTNGTITYSPDPAFCGSTDNFMYLLCTDGGCDTALVTVMVTCDDSGTAKLAFYQAISPNGDGMNDAFVIENVDKYPGNLLQIYNRWGNMVYRRENYTSRTEWDGTWDGKPLPDGTYFYMFYDGKGSSHDGCVYLGR